MGATPTVRLTRRASYARAPALVEWEATRACALTCRHCRRDAILWRHPRELSSREARQLLEQVRAFSNPPPSLLVAGGDALMRPDLLELLAYGARLGLDITVALCATDKLTEAALASLGEVGVTRVSLGLDGPDSASHDGFRGKVTELEPAEWVVEFPVPGRLGGDYRPVNPWQYGVVLHWLDSLAQKVPFAIVTRNGPQFHRLAYSACGTRA